MALPRVFWNWLQSQADLSELRCRDDILGIYQQHSSNICVLLDCGCGAGEFTERTAQVVRAKYVLGIDVVPENVIAARSRGIHGIVGNLDRCLPVAENSIDFVLASHVIEHLSDTDNFVKECYRVLRPGGRLLVATPNLAGFTNILLLILGKQPSIAEVSDVALVGTWSPRGDRVRRAGPAHRRIFTSGALRGLLRYYGFECKNVGGSGFLPLSGRLAQIAASLLPVYATNLIATAVKPKAGSPVSIT